MRPRPRRGPAPKPEQIAQAQALAELGRRDPAAWIEQATGERLWSMQQEIAQAVFRPNAKVCVKGCNGAGKTHLAARLVLAFFYSFPESKVLTTAPTWTSVATQMWAQIDSAHQKLPADMGGVLTETRLSASKSWWARGLSTNKEERFKGHHAPRMLIVLDETPGIREEIHVAVRSMRSAGHVSVLELGNPTVASGTFYDHFAADSSVYTQFTIDAFESPNLVGLGDSYESRLERLLELDEDELYADPWPEITSRHWVKEQYLELGVDHPMWLATVRAQFPSNDPLALIPLAKIEQAKSAWQNYLKPEFRHPPKSALVGLDIERFLTMIAPGPDWRWRAGVDVAGQGEAETTLHVAYGPIVVHSEGWPQEDPRGYVLAALAPYLAHDPRMQINIDSIGMGEYFWRHFKDQGLNAHAVNVGKPSKLSEKFPLLKDEYCWGLRMRFMDGQIAFAPWLNVKKLVPQLSVIRWKPDERGRNKIESKDALKARGFKSPDYFESLMLLFAGKAGGSKTLVSWD